MIKEPLFLTSRLQEKIWGGVGLKEFGYDLPSEKVGEYWAISAHPHGLSRIANGAYKGESLDQVYANHRELFAHSRQPNFPLLTKILDANDWLSVQVHPDDAYAREHEGELGKTESWYIISAKPGAEIIYGHRAQTKEELKDRIAAGDWDQLLRKVPVKAGDFFYVPSGTMHAIGSGIMVLETQQSSDTTYRVYDFDRRDEAGNLRDLHIQASIDVLTVPGDDLPSNQRSFVQVEGGEITELLRSDFFDVYKWEIAGNCHFQKRGAYTLLSVLEGNGNLEVEEKTYSLKKGDHLILPATIETWTLNGDLTLIASNPGRRNI